MNKQSGEDLPQTARNKIRSLPKDNRIILERSIKSVIAEHESPATSDCSMLFDITVDKAVAIISSYHISFFTLGF